MYQHPKLGCDCEWRFDDHWCRWAVVERIVWSVVIYCRVTLPGHMAPFLDHILTPGMGTIQGGRSHLRNLWIDVNTFPSRSAFCVTRTSSTPRSSTPHRWASWVHPHPRDARSIRFVPFSVSSDRPSRLAPGQRCQRTAHHSQHQQPFPRRRASPSSMSPQSGFPSRF